MTFERGGQSVHSLRGVSLDVGTGEILAVVGESGSGKSVLGMALLGLLSGDPMPKITGRAEVCGIDMVSAPDHVRRATRKAHLGAVFQDPMTSLNPTMRVGRQVVEAAGSREQALRLLELAGVPDPASRMGAYPHELSGGLRQRVMIAMAVAGTPDLVIADEPTTALDVTVQAQVLALIRALCDELKTSFILVTHDIGVASQIADRVAVMYGGRLVEIGPAAAVVGAPAHPYTAGLLGARLRLDLPRGQRIPTLRGSPPDPRAEPAGCAFAPRCTAAGDACDHAVPALVSAGEPDRLAACVIPDAVSEVRNDGPGGGFAPLLDVKPSRPALRVNSVDKEFSLATGWFKKQSLRALDNIILDIAQGSALAVVGESGSGKSTLLRVVAGLMAPDHGDIDRGPGPQMVFQDAGASLTPWLTVGELVGERLAGISGRSERREKVVETLRLVGLPPDVADIRAGVLSGGQRQRVGIARAIVVPPQLLLCDEPTSALDAPLAASVLNLLQDLRRRLGMAIMFVTHDLAAARFLSDRIAVMRQGQIIESGDTEAVITAPQHEYTRSLLAAVPELALWTTGTAIPRDEIDMSSGKDKGVEK
ncbi:MAG: ABC transporter ATP-binding protein [Mycobacterium sp.]